MLPRRIDVNNLEPSAEVVSLSTARRDGRPALADSLRLSEEIFRAIFEEAGSGMALVDLEGHPIATNAALREMLGYSEEELRKMAFPEFTHPADVDTDWDLFQELIRGERRRYRLEKRYIRKDGEVVSGRLTASLVRNVDGSPRYAVGMVEDVTELKRSGEERKRLRARLAHAQEEERRRIAEGLHDDPVQRLTAIGLRLAVLAPVLGSEDQRRQAATLQDALTDTIGRLRSLMFDLRPPALDREGLAEALRQLLHRLEAETGWTWQVRNRLSSEPPPEVAAVAYRILREAIANSGKHAEASKVTVTLESDDTEIRGRATDNGRGFDVDAAEAGAIGHLGLPSMRERAELFGGWLQIQSEPSKGTTVRFALPIM